MFGLNMHEIQIIGPQIADVCCVERGIFVPQYGGA